MQFVLDISSDSDSDLTMDTGLKAATFDDPALTTIKPEPVEGDVESHFEMEPRSDTAQPKIKLEPDDEAEAQLTTTIAELEAALEAKNAATNTSVAEAPNGQSAVINAAPVDSTVDALAEYLVTRPFDAGERAKPALITSSASVVASAQSGVQRTPTHNDNRFQPYQAPAQPVQAVSQIQPPTLTNPTGILLPPGVVYENYGFLYEPIDGSGMVTIIYDHIIIENCTITAKKWFKGLRPSYKVTARNCQFLDGAHFRGQHPFVAEGCLFEVIETFKANQNFTATNCAFWSDKNDGKITISRTVWDSCKDCAFHGEVYINKRPAWNGVMIDSNILMST